jgi:hypothetical protein
MQGGYATATSIICPEGRARLCASIPFKQNKGANCFSSLDCTIASRFKVSRLIQLQLASGICSTWNRATSRIPLHILPFNDSAAEASFEVLRNLVIQCSIRSYSDRPTYPVVPHALCWRIIFCPCKHHSGECHSSIFRWTSKASF